HRSISWNWNIINKWKREGVKLILATWLALVTELIYQLHDVVMSQVLYMYIIQRQASQETFIGNLESIQLYLIKIMHHGMRWIETAIETDN
ncbi:hypothetical protein ACJX0J_016748, partial [Zea mays]